MDKCKRGHSNWHTRINGTRFCRTCRNLYARRDYDRDRERERVALKQYHLNVEDRTNLWLSQNRKCAICRISIELWDKNTNVDHDHRCCPGKRSCGECVRGLLCTQCNNGIGNFRDNIENLKSAIRYLSRGG